MLFAGQLIQLSQLIFLLLQTQLFPDVEILVALSASLIEVVSVLFQLLRQAYLEKIREIGYLQKNKIA